jgi:sugar transferase (PEP-CTERM/EpsH1 system associated)
VLNVKIPTVCHVLHSLHYGGAEVLARRFAEGLRSEFRPVFACLDDLGPLGERLRGHGVPVCVLDRRPGFDVRCVWRLARWLREQHVDLVHAHQYAPFFYSSLARWTAGRIPVLFTEHGRDYPDHRRWKRVMANRVLLRRHDHVVAVGQDVRRALIDYEGLPQDRIEVIYNGVSAQPFASDRAATRFALGYTDEHLIIIQVARLNRLKDHPTAIRAIADLAKCHPHVRLLLVGDGEEREPIEALIDSLGLRDFVRLLGTRTDVPRLLHAADLFLLTSISEGIPLTLVEGMLARLPIVATRVGGVPEVIAHEQSGLLVESGDVAGIAHCLRRMMADDQLRREMGDAGHCRAERSFTDERMLHGYRLVYEAMTARGSKELRKQIAIGVEDAALKLGTPSRLAAGGRQ